MNNTPTPDTPFNFAMLFYMGLNQLLNRAEMAYTDGDLNAWYRALKAIRQRISFKIDIKKALEIDAKFKEAKDLLGTIVPRQLSGGQQIFNDRTAEILESISQELWSIMDKNKMIFPDIKINGGFEAIRRSMGIGK